VKSKVGGDVISGLGKIEQILALGGVEKVGAVYQKLEYIEQMLESGGIQKVGALAEKLEHIQRMLELKDSDDVKERYHRLSHDGSVLELYSVRIEKLENVISGMKTVIDEQHQIIRDIKDAIYGDWQSYSRVEDLENRSRAKERGLLMIASCTEDIVSFFSEHTSFLSQRFRGRHIVSH